MKRLNILFFKYCFMLEKRDKRSKGDGVRVESLKKSANVVLPIDPKWKHGCVRPSTSFIRLSSIRHIKVE